MVEGAPRRNKRMPDFEKLLPGASIREENHDRPSGKLSVVKISRGSNSYVVQDFARNEGVRGAGHQDVRVLERTRKRVRAARR